MLNRKFLLLFLLPIGAAILLFAAIQKNKAAAEASAQTILQLQHAFDQTKAFATTLLDIESKVRGYVITGNHFFLQDYEEDKKRLASELRYTERFFGKDPVQQQTLDSLNRLVAAKLALQDSIIAAYAVAQRDALHVVASLRGQHQTESIRRLLEGLEEKEREILEEKITANRLSLASRYTTIGLVVMGCLLLLSLAGWVIYRELRLRRRAELESAQKEEKYQSLIENSSVVMFTTDDKGYISFVSSNVADLTGYSKQELAGKHYTILLPQDWKEKVMAHYQSQRNNRVQETILRFPIVTREGHRKWVDQNTMLLQKGESVTGFQSIVTDVTENKLGEDLIREAEQKFQAEREEILFRLQAILDNIPMIVYIKDLQGRFILANKLFSERYGLPAEEIIGRTAEEIVPDKSKVQRYTGTDEEVITNHKIVEFEDAVKTPTGEGHMLVTKFPLFDKEQSLFGVCGIHKDITEMVESRVQLLAAKQKAEKAERLQEEFLANMSHEIRTPMNGIVGMTNLLLETPLTDPQKDYLQVICQSSDLLLALINDILDISKIKAGKMEVDNRPFSLHDALGNAVSPIRHKLKPGVDLVVDTAADLPPYLNGDAHKLNQVLINLLGNAAKFTEEGEVRVQVQVASETADAVILQFIVSDTGIGIAEENLQLIFESFAQGNSDTMHKFGGTGLGLAITRRLVELQGGSISVQSRQGAGTIFYFQVPYKLASAPEVTIVKEEKSPREEEATGSRHILVVEDNLVNQKVVVSILRNRQFACTVANHGKEAVALLESGQRFDAILMDLQMPEMDGYQAATYIRQKLKLPVPIVAMTASALRNEKEHCFEVGMNEYLTKPFVPETLVQHLQRIIAASEDVADRQAASASEGLYSLAQLKELGDASIQAEILNLFLQSAPELLQRLKEAELHSNWEDARKAAHELKSTVGILQATGMLEKCSGIEIAVKEKRYTGIGEMVKKLTREFELVRVMVEDELRALQQG